MLFPSLEKSVDDTAVPSKINRLNSNQFSTLLPATDAENLKIPRRDGYRPARPQNCTNIYQLQLFKEKCFFIALILPLLPGIRLGKVLHLSLAFSHNLMEETQSSLLGLDLILLFSERILNCFPCVVFGTQVVLQSCIEED